MVCNLIQLFGLWRQVSCIFLKMSLSCSYYRYRHWRFYFHCSCFSVYLSSCTIFISNIYHFHQRVVLPSLEKLGVFVEWHALFWMSFLVMFLMSFLSVFWISLLVMFWSLFSVSGYLSMLYSRCLSMLCLGAFSCYFLDVLSSCILLCFGSLFFLFLDVYRYSCCVFDDLSCCFRCLYLLLCGCLFFLDVF